MMTIARIEDILQEEIKKAEDAGIKLYHIMSSVSVFRSVRTYAKCSRKMINGKKIAFISISKYFLDSPEDVVRATIMHEVLHATEGSKGHGQVWKMAAARINRIYGYNIKTLGIQVAGADDVLLEKEKEKMTGVPTFKHVVRCSRCGVEFKRTRESNLTKHPEHYHCKCGGKLERVC